MARRRKSLPPISMEIIRASDIWPVARPATAEAVAWVQPPALRPPSPMRLAAIAVVKELTAATGDSVLPVLPALAPRA